MVRSTGSKVSRTLCLALLMQATAALFGGSTLAQTTAPVVQVQVNQSAFTPGQPLRLSASVTNPGGGPSADFYVGIQLPDGVSTVSVRLGGSPAVGSLANLAGLAPTAADVNLTLPFAVSEAFLLAYTFTGNEPPGSYLAYIAAVVAGGLRDGALGAGELLAFHSVAFTFGSGGILLSGAPGAPALQATSGYHGSTGVDAAAIAIDGAGRRIARTQLEVKFRADATVAQVNTALTSVNGRIVSMLPGVLILLVEIPDPGSLAALDALTTRLGQSPGVVAVIQQGFPDLATLPPNVSLISSDLDKIDHLLASRTHAAWNTEAALRRPGIVRPLLVLGDGFGLTQPGAPFDVATVAGDYANTTYEQHGYHVLGTIAAAFGGDTTEAGLATGLLPGTTSARAVDLQDNNPTAGDFQNRMLTHVRSHAGNVVLNTSLQFDCRTSQAVAANCVTAPAQLEGSIWLEKVRGTAAVTVQGAGLEGKFLQAAAAGNVTVGGDLDTTTGTPYAAAALIAGMTDANGAAVPNAINTLVVENQLNTPGPYLPSCLAAGSKRVLTRTPSTNLVNISAIGTDVFNLRAPTIAAGNLSGTSMATPQVAALALWVWTLRPNLTNRQVMQIITSSADTAVAPLVDARCSQVSNPAPSIDVYAAVLATDTALADAPVRFALFDVADANGNDVPDGVFDEHDTGHIHQAFSAAGGALDFSRYDLNGDGETAGSGGASFDLDFDRLYQTATRQTGSISRRVNELVATDLDVLCHYAYSSMFGGDTTVRNNQLGAQCGLSVVEVTASSLSAAVQGGAGGTSNSVSYSDATPDIPAARGVQGGVSAYSGGVRADRFLTTGALNPTEILVSADAGHFEPAGTTAWSSQASVRVELIVRAARAFALRQYRFHNGGGDSMTSVTRFTGVTDAGQAVSLWNDTETGIYVVENGVVPVAIGVLQPGRYVMEIQSSSLRHRDVDASLRLTLTTPPQGPVAPPASMTAGSAAPRQGPG